VGGATARDRLARGRGDLDARAAALGAGARAGARATPGRDGRGVAVARGRALLVPSGGVARGGSGATRARARLRRSGARDRGARLRLLRPSGRDHAGRDAWGARRSGRRDDGRALHAGTPGARPARGSLRRADPPTQRRPAARGRRRADLRPGHAGALRVGVVEARKFFVRVSANVLACVALVSCLAARLLAQAEPGDSLPLAIPDVPGPLAFDGRLDDSGWAHAARLTTFYETWPGDNVAPPVRTVVAITYDAHALYVGIWAQDPDPARLRAAYADRDNVGPGDDYVALVLDTRGDGRVGMIFRVSPRGVQADGVFNEAQFALGNNPDDLTPDFAWDARTAIGDSAWTAELRVPFTSLRYAARERQTWGVIVHRVYPRELTHSLSSVRMPRGTTCFLCHA